MKRMLFIAGLLLVTIFVIGVAKADPEPSKPQINCQYPVRPLNPDGSCDNSDPCDPTTIKTNGGKCQDEAPVKAQTQPGPTGTGK